MSASVKKGTFVANTVTGAQAITGVGFQPKFIVLWTNGRTADGSSALGDTDRTCRGIGVSSTQRACAGYTVPDNVSASAGEIVWDETAIVHLIETTGTDYCLADLTSLDAGGFTINWTTAPAAAIVVHYEAFGGADITNVKLGFTASLSASQNPGTQAITGMGFKPDGLMFLCAGRTATGALATSAPEFSHGFAAASGQFAQHITGVQSAADCLYADTTTHVAQVQSLDTDGFTLNWHPAPSTAVRFAYIGWKGGSVYVGTDTEPTTNVSQSKTGLSFRPVGLMFTGISGVASGGKATWFLGGSDGTAHGATSVEAINANPIRSAVGGISTEPIQITTESGGTAIARGDAAFTSMNSDGYTLTWTNTDGTARTFGVLAIGSSPAAAPFLPRFISSVST